MHVRSIYCFARIIQRFAHLWHGPRRNLPLKANRCGAAAVLLLAFAGALAAQTAPDAALDLDRFRGRVVVLDFWASWCTPCRRSIPWLNTMQAKYADGGLVIIGVNVDKEYRDAERFLAETPADFQIVFDPEGQLPAQYAVTAMPSSYVFDRSGQLVAKHLGFQNAKRAEYEEILRKLVLAEEIRR